MKSAPKKHFLKFYADLPDKPNTYFIFEVEDILKAQDVLVSFFREYKYKIRAAYYINKNNVSFRIDNIDFKNHVTEAENEQFVIKQQIRITLNKFSKKDKP